MNRGINRLRSRTMLGAAVAGAVVGLSALAQAAEGADAVSLIKERCSSCHEARPDGGFNRISDIRKTPEGWEMTLFRMKHVHKAEINSTDAAALIKYLSDTQGLAPGETTAYRPILERQPAAQEVETDTLVLETCARCHSSARVGLERRDEAEWLKLSNFHLGQFPTAEYHLMARDREWWKIISTDVPPVLAKRFPLQTAEWDAWKAKPKADLAGTWSVAGVMPGKGAYGGVLTVDKGTLPDTYTLHADLTGPDGKALAGIGSAVVFTGYEWRASLSLGGVDMRQIMALSADGTSLTGRTFQAAHDEIGGAMTAVRGNAPVLAGLSAASLKAGQSATVTLWGNALTGVPDFGKGVKVSLVGRQPGAVTVKLTADASAAPGYRTVTINGASLDQAFAVYKTIDRVAVEPAVAVARVGGNNGTTVPVLSQAEAVGYLNGADGKPGTEDDVRLGMLPATWSHGPNDAAATEAQDAKFAGVLQGDGLFVPAAAGPNPERVFGTNNVGDLKLTATVKDGKKTLTGDGRLVVTVQRWNDPPIR